MHNVKPILEVKLILDLFFNNFYQLNTADSLLPVTGISEHLSPNTGACPKTLCVHMHNKHHTFYRLNLTMYYIFFIINTQ